MQNATLRQRLSDICQDRGLSQERGIVTPVKTRGCLNTAEPTQRGYCEDKGCLGAVRGFYQMRTARAQTQHRYLWGSMCIGNVF